MCNGAGRLYDTDEVDEPCPMCSEDGYIYDKKLMTIGMWTYNPIDLEVTDFEGISLRKHYIDMVRNLLAKGEQLQLIPDAPNDPHVHQRPMW